MFPIESLRTRPHCHRKVFFPVNNESQSTNPLREGLPSRPLPQPCSVVIFGVSAVLTFRSHGN